MTWKLYAVAGLAYNVLVVCCASNDPGDGGTATSVLSASSTMSTTGGDGSGSVTSAPGSDSAPTIATTAITTEPSTSGSTGEPCNPQDCDDTSQSERECDNFAQDCPEGQKCSAYNSNLEFGYWDSTKCVEVIGTDKPGEPCTSEGMAAGIDSCIEGAMCWDVDADGFGTCVGLCSGSAGAPVCDFPGYCDISAEGVLNLCYGYCNPLLQDCPNVGEACYASQFDKLACAPDESNGGGQAGDSCEFINECKVGLTCTDAMSFGAGCAPDSTGCCTPFCKFPDGACPNPGQQCVQYFDNMQIPSDNPYLGIGICGIAG